MPHLTADTPRLRFKKALLSRFFIRFHMTLILLATFFLGLISDKILYWLGDRSLTFRYGLSVLLSYCAFFTLVRLWLSYVGRYKRSGMDSIDLDWLQYVDSGSGPAADPAAGDAVSGFHGGGGHSGGGGASAHWAAGADAKANAIGAGIDAKVNLLSSSAEIAASGEGILLLPLLLLFAALVLVIAGTGIYLVYGAPEILTEAAFQAALSTSLIRISRKIDQPDWSGSVLKLTWKPFLTILVIALLTGVCARSFCPSATRLPDLWRVCR